MTVAGGEKERRLEESVEYGEDETKKELKTSREKGRDV